MLFDTTGRAIHRNSRQLQAKKSAYLGRFCILVQRVETGIGGLWLRRARVRRVGHPLTQAGRPRMCVFCNRLRKRLQSLGQTEGPGNAPLL